MGPAPLGYGKDDGDALELGEFADVVREAFRIAASAPEGRQAHAADEYLAAQIPGRRRHVSDTRRLLKNRAYLGEHHLAGGKAHDPITTPAIFAAAQSQSRGRRKNGDYPLSHVATCAACGAGLVGALQTVKGRKYRRMRCSATCAGGVGSVSADALEALVRDALRPALADKVFRLAMTPATSTAQPRRSRRRVRAHSLVREDLEARRRLGDEAWRAGLRARARRSPDAGDELAAVAAQSARSERLPGPEELDDPEQFARALAVIGRLEVAGGRRPIGRAGRA
jgi:hypothetical protein